MSVERDIRFDLVARLCPNTTGAELKSVATEVISHSLEHQAKSFMFDHTRRGCLLFARAGKWPLSETSWMLLRRWFDREQSFLARKSSHGPPNFWLIKCQSTVRCTKYIIDRLKLDDTPPLDEIPQSPVFRVHLRNRARLVNGLKPHKSRVWTEAFRRR